MTTGIRILWLKAREAEFNLLWAEALFNPSLLQYQINIDSSFPSMVIVGKLLGGYSTIRIAGIKNPEATMQTVPHWKCVASLGSSTNP